MNILFIVGLIAGILCWILTIGYVYFGPEALNVDKKEFKKEAVYRLVCSVLLSLMWLWLFIHQG